MISLLIDTSSFNLLIYLVKDNKILNFCKLKNIKSHSTIVLSKIEEILKDSSINVKDIDNIFVVNGPGSFTGLRIGVTIAKMLGFTLNKKVIPISSLELLATTSFNTDYIVPIIDARRGYVYSGIYDKNLNIYMNDQYIKLENLLSSLDKNKTYTFVSYDNIDIPSLELPDENTIKIIEKHINDMTINVHLINPNYLKKTEAEEKLQNDKICN